MLPADRPTADRPTADRPADRPADLARSRPAEPAHSRSTESAIGGRDARPGTPSARAALLDWPDELQLVPWVDPLVDRLGHDARSAYVETFWLGVLGPSATWLLRRAVAWLEASPDGVLVDLDELAGSLGLGGRGGRRLPFYRALDRCVLFGMVQRLGDQLAVRRRLPPLPARHLARLPRSVQEQHERWVADHRRAQADDAQERARQLALSLLRMGEDPPGVEQQLARWRIHPAAAHQAVAWALAHERDTPVPGGATHPAGTALAPPDGPGAPERLASAAGAAPSTGPGTSGTA